MTIREFQKLIYTHYRTHGRDLPWRKTRDPYRILVSEVMLQQTQVGRVLKKYSEFLRAFPDLKTLARAPARNVLKVWQGMGYNRRAIALKRTAETIVRSGRGVPSDPGKLRQLSGIGPATAAAIVLFAFNKPAVYLDTNVRSVYLYHFFPRRARVLDRELVPLIERTIDTKRPREWYWALLDYGATLKRRVANPSRRSAHYIRQGLFKGSNRELRGALVRLLLRQPKLSVHELSNILDTPRAAVLRNIKRLKEDGINLSP